MKHVEPSHRWRSAHDARVLTLALTRVIAFAALAMCLACSSMDGPPLRDGAVRAWYLPLGLLLIVLRSGARRDIRRPLSLALFVLAVGALAARAVDARSASPDDGGAPTARSDC